MQSIFNEEEAIYSFNFISKTATKGRTNHLLKKSSALSSNRKPSKKFDADFSDLLNYNMRNEQNENEEDKEESKEEDDMI